MKRSFYDFHKLREKLCQNWPGMYIPEIPPHDRLLQIKYIFNPQKEEDHYYHNRLVLLNKFCRKICQNQFLYNSDEVKIFLSEVEDVITVILINILFI